MKREEKNALSRQRIIDAAVKEFSEKGYAGASLNVICAEYDISKGIIYHYFKDKDELYLLCVEKCFQAMTEYLQTQIGRMDGAPEGQLATYFEARLRFFGLHPVYLGLFADAALNPPAALADQIAVCRSGFDALNISILTELLNAQTLRKGLEVSVIVEDFRAYMDFFNMRFREAFREKGSFEEIIKEHEERCHRQLDMLLHGVWGEEK